MEGQDLLVHFIPNVSVSLCGSARETGGPNEECGRYEQRRSLGALTAYLVCVERKSLFSLIT